MRIYLSIVFTPFVLCACGDPNASEARSEGLPPPVATSHLSDQQLQNAVNDATVQFRAALHNAYAAYFANSTLDESSGPLRDDTARVAVVRDSADAFAFYADVTVWATYLRDGLQRTTGRLFQTTGKCARENGLWICSATPPTSPGVDLHIVCPEFPSDQLGHELSTAAAGPFGPSNSR